MVDVRKKVLSLLLAVALLFSIGAMSIQTAYAADGVEGIHDIFEPKDNSPLEQFKARVLNRLLYLDAEIDVSDLNLKDNDIQYTINGIDLTGIYAAREIVRQNPLYSTAATTGFPAFTYKENGCVATVKYTYHPAWTQDFVKKVIASYDEVMAMIQPDDSDFAKILKIHDWIVKNVSYGMSTLYYDFAVGALANRKAVCSGYAQCNQFLLSQVGIESVYIAANTVKEPHAWNLVKLEGHWFHVDCTWDRGVGLNPNVNHTYFMLSDAEFNADGVHSEDWKTPSKGYPTNNLCSIANKFYKDNKDVATNEQIAANPITIKHTADPTKDYQANDLDHWRTCPEGVEVDRALHTGNPCTVCGHTKATYTVRITTDGNGTASAIPETAEAGAEITLSATPNTGYHFKEWKVIRGSVTITDHKFTMPASYVEVQAVFEKDALVTYTVTVTTNGNGTASAAPKTAEVGTEIKLTAAPDAGYHFKEWKVIRGGVTITDHKFTMPANNVEVQAVFEKDAPVTHTVTVTTNGNGTASAAPKTAEAGTEIKLTAVPDVGYHFKEWKVIRGGVTITDHKFSMPASDVEVQAVFEKDAPTVYTVSYAWGSDFPTGETIPTDGNAFQSVDAAKAAVDSRYTAGYKVEGQKNGKDGTWTFSGWTATVENNVVRFTGSWSFTEKQTPVEPKPPVTPVRPSKPAQPSQRPNVKPSLPFADVAESAWYRDAVSYAYQNSIMTGTSRTEFSPEATTTRGMIVTMLYRMEKEPAAGGTNPFVDAQSGYYANAVRWASANDLVTGTSSTEFSPNAPITREQLAVMLYRYAKYLGRSTTATASLDQFTDGSAVSGYAREAMRWAVTEGLLDGVGGSRLAPNEAATRAQVAAILYRFLRG